MPPVCPLLLAVLAQALVATSQITGSPIASAPTSTSSPTMQWRRFGPGCCRNRCSATGNIHGNFTIIVAESSYLCKRVCRSAVDCVAVEYDQRFDICELHTELPTHTSTLGEDNGCTGDRRKCYILNQHFVQDPCPTAAPTRTPTATPTFTPTAAPTLAPTTVAPTASPTSVPTTASPTTSPTPASPSRAPTSTPSASPTARWQRLGGGCCRFNCSATSMYGTFSIVTADSSNACKLACRELEVCVAVEYDQRFDICELHTELPTHTSTLGEDNGCTGDRRKCFALTQHYSRPAPAGTGASSAPTPCPTAAPATTTTAAAAAPTAANSSSPGGDGGPPAEDGDASGERDTSPSSAGAALHTRASVIAVSVCAAGVLIIAAAVTLWQNREVHFKMNVRGGVSSAPPSSRRALVVNAHYEASPGTTVSTAALLPLPVPPTAPVPAAAAYDTFVWWDIERAGRQPIEASAIDAAEVVGGVATATDPDFDEDNDLDLAVPCSYATAAGVFELLGCTATDDHVTKTDRPTNRFVRNPPSRHLGCSTYVHEHGPGRTTAATSGAAEHDYAKVGGSRPAFRGDGSDGYLDIGGEGISSDDDTGSAASTPCYVPQLGEDGEFRTDPEPLYYEAEVDSAGPSGGIGSCNGSGRRPRALSWRRMLRPARMQRDSDESTYSVAYSRPAAETPALVYYSPAAPPL